MNNLIFYILAIVPAFFSLTLGCNKEESPPKHNQTPAYNSVKFYVASDTKREGLIRLRVWEDIAINANQVLFIQKRPFMTGTSVVDIKLGMDEQNSHSVLFELNDDGREALFQATQESIGERIAILRDAEVLSAPYFSAPIESNYLEIGNNMTLEESEILHKSLTKSPSETSVKN